MAMAMVTAVVHFLYKVLWDWDSGLESEKPQELSRTALDPIRKRFAKTGPGTNGANWARGFSH